MEKIPKNGTKIDLKTHFDEILIEKDRAIRLALDSAKEAVKVAETSAEKWRDNANEWRGAMDDREGRFALKDDIINLKEILEDLKIQLGEVRSQLSSMSGRRAGLQDGWGWLVAAISIIGVIWKMLVG